MGIEWTWSSAGAMAGVGVLADAAVKGTILLGLAWGVTAGLRRGSAAVRHWVWMAAMAGLVALPVLGVVMPGWGVLPFSILDFRVSIDGAKEGRWRSCRRDRWRGRRWHLREVRGWPRQGRLGRSRHRGR